MHTVLSMSLTLKDGYPVRTATSRQQWMFDFGLETQQCVEFYRIKTEGTCKEARCKRMCRQEFKLCIRYSILLSPEATGPSPKEGTVR